MRTFEDYIKVILKHEGGYVNNPSDPGGETNYGISKRAYPNLDINNLTIEQASEIYYNDYWLKMNLDLLSNDLLKLHLFDMGVNTGIKTSVILLQKILQIVQDGIIGPNTASISNQFGGNLVQSYIEARENYYKYIVQIYPNEEIFLKGWINRILSTNF
jgi:lysozyme family protein